MLKKMDLNEGKGDPALSESEKDSDIKSKAIVQYTRSDEPKLFHQLQQNFNIKLPPNNWLHAGTQWYQYMRSASLGKYHQFSSFNMANSFPHLAGETDVISDAENIKKLLKVAYSKGHLSMMVHRVGDSLLLDDFDIHRHLLRQQQSDWTWLRRFYMEVVARNLAQDKIIVKKNKSRLHLQNQNMFSKFLYYSAAEENSSEQERMETQTIKNTTPSAPPSRLPDCNSPQKSEYLRTVRWTFEDIHMLIGNDMPIFGGKTHPCVSLKLQECGKPISVLTGMDYWLDNLMCNVPELAMCYHVDGIVQKYELIKTEEIPNLCESKFSPQVVRDIAQNILSFLKSSTTKEGHTYWLFKGQNDDVVKLYDLTTLCEPDTAQENPFTVPVGILLYRVARNMRQTAGRKKAATIRRLLENCLKLLDKHEHAQTVTSAHYMLADLYLGNDIRPVPMLCSADDGVADEMTSSAEDDGTLSSDLSEELSSNNDSESESLRADEENNETESVQDDDESNCDNDPKEQQQQTDYISCDKPSEESRYKKEEGLQRTPTRERQSYNKERSPEPEGKDSPAVVSVDVHSLQKHVSASAHSERTHLRAAPITGSVSERCDESIAHVAQGLACLDMSAAQQSKSASQRVDQQAECNPSQAIPMADKREKTPPSTSSVIPDTGMNGAWPDLGPDSWHAWSKTLLLSRAAVACCAEAEQRLERGEYGHAIRLARTVLLMHSAMKVLSPNKAQEQVALVPAALRLLGDGHLLLAHAQDTEKYREASETPSEHELVLQESARAHAREYEYAWIDVWAETAHAQHERSVRLYENALSIAKQSHNTNMAHLLKLLANSLNELGVFYMNQAAKTKQHTEWEDLIRRSSDCLQRGLAHFDSLGDRVNMALLHSNRGRLQRLCASLVRQVMPDSAQFSAAERKYFIQAQEEYCKALSLLVKRETQPQIWDSISWELSSTHFAMATNLQDYAPLATMAQDQVEKEVTEQMHKALKYCEYSFNVKNGVQPQYQYRAATIHHRLASLYHHGFRDQVIEQKRKHLRQLAELHYNKASELFNQLEAPCEQLRVKLELVAMTEYQLEGVSSTSGKLKLLQTNLQQLLSCTTVLGWVTSQEAEELGEEELGRLLSLLMSRITCTLLALVKHTKAPQRKGKKPSSAEEENYKVLYAHTLKQSAKISDSTALKQRILHIQSILQYLCQSVKYTPPQS